MGSLSDTKPSLKIKMDAYVADQTMSGLSRFTLNNSVQDASYVNQCLGYRLFRKAGVAEGSGLHGDAGVTPGGPHIDDDGLVLRLGRFERSGVVVVNPLDAQIVRHLK